MFPKIIRILAFLHIFPDLTQQTQFHFPTWVECRLPIKQWCFYVKYWEKDKGIVPNDEIARRGFHCHYKPYLEFFKRHGATTPDWFESGYRIHVWIRHNCTDNGHMKTDTLYLNQFEDDIDNITIPIGGVIDNKGETCYLWKNIFTEEIDTDLDTIIEKEK